MAFESSILVSAKTETSITIKWTANATVTQVSYRYKVGSGSYGSYTRLTVSAKSESFKISSLSPNTSYTIQVDLQTSSTGSNTTLSEKTYAWPHALAPIGGAVKIWSEPLKLAIANPLKRKCDVEITVGSTLIESFSNVTSSEIVIPNTAYYIEAFLETIPNSMTGTYGVSVLYSGHETVTTGMFSAEGAYPMPDSIAYQDVNSTAQAIIQNNQIILQNVSTPRFTVSGWGRYGATIVGAKVVILGVETTLTASGDYFVGTTPVINSGSDVYASVILTDSRGNTNETAGGGCNVTMEEYESPYAQISLARENNYYSTVYLTVDAHVMSIGSNTATITGRYKEKGSSSWTTISNIQDNTQKTLTLDNTKAYDVQITITDSFGASTTYNESVQIGMPIIYFDRLLRAVGINCFPDASGQFAISNIDMSFTNAEYDSLADKLGITVGSV